MATQPEVSDFIGCARIKLDSLLKSPIYEDLDCPIRNDKGTLTGKVELELKFYDLPAGYRSIDDLEFNTKGKKSMESLNSEIIEKQVLIEIAKRMVDQGLNDFETLLDTMFL